MVKNINFGVSVANEKVCGNNEADSSDTCVSEDTMRAILPKIRLVVSYVDQFFDVMDYDKPTI